LYLKSYGILLLLYSLYFYLHLISLNYMRVLPYQTDFVFLYIVYHTTVADHSSAQHSLF
jgi:hypothetical protein